jgi:hypothetical protein
MTLTGKLMPLSRSPILDPDRYSIWLVNLPAYSVARKDAAGIFISWDNLAELVRNP